MQRFIYFYDFYKQLTNTLQNKLKGNIADVKLNICKINLD